MESGTSLTTQLGRFTHESIHETSFFDLRPLYIMATKQDPTNQPGPCMSDYEHMANLHHDYRRGVSSKVNESSLRSHPPASACLSLLYFHMRLTTTLFSLTFSHFFSLRSCSPPLLSFPYIFFPADKVHPVLLASPHPYCHSTPHLQCLSSGTQTLNASSFFISSNTATSSPIQASSTASQPRWVET